MLARGEMLSPWQEVKIRCHDLRVDFCTRAYEAEIPVKTLQAWMGHEDATLEVLLSRGNYNTLSIYCEQPKKRMNILKILRFHGILSLIVCSYQFRSFRHVISFNEVDSHV